MCLTVLINDHQKTYYEGNLRSQGKREKKECCWGFFLLMNLLKWEPVHKNGANCNNCNTLVKPFELDMRVYTCELNSFSQYVEVHACICHVIMCLGDVLHSTTKDKPGQVQRDLSALPEREDS